MSPRQSQAIMLLLGAIYMRALDATMEPGPGRIALALIAGLIVGWAWRK